MCFVYVCVFLVECVVKCECGIVSVEMWVFDEWCWCECECVVVGGWWLRFVEEGVEKGGGGGWEGVIEGWVCGGVWGEDGGVVSGVGCVGVLVWWCGDGVIEGNYGTRVDAGGRVEWNVEGLRGVVVRMCV